MNNISVIEDILNFQCEEKIEITSYSNIEGKRLLFGIRCNASFTSCPGCGRRTSKRQDHTPYKQKTNLKHIVFSDNRIVEICPERRYFRCDHCGDQFFEHFSFESRKGYHTIAFESYVLASWGYLSGSEVGRLCGISSSKVYTITQHIDVGKLNERGMKLLEEIEEIHLGIDEHSFRGRDMILVITELKKKEVIAILHGITSEILESWINSLSPEIQKKIVGFSTDMNKGYRGVLESLLHRPLHVVDKYHLFQEVSRMMTDVLDVNIWATRMGFIKADDLIKLGKVPKKFTEEERKKLKQESLAPMKKYKDRVDQRLQTKDIHPSFLKDQKGKPIFYKEITLEYFLEKKYISLFRTREKNLFSYQKLRLNQILGEFDYKNFLKEAWLLKETFCEALDERNIEAIDQIIVDCGKSEHYRIQQFGRTLSNWYRGIENYCKLSTDDFKFTNAYTECINNQCKLAKRQSYGFRYKENYSRKLYAKFSR